MKTVLNEWKRKDIGHFCFECGRETTGPEHVCAPEDLEADYPEDDEDDRAE